jgi:hypothetical protein
MWPAFLFCLLGGPVVQGLLYWSGGKPCMWKTAQGWSDNPKWKQTCPQTPTRFAPNVKNKSFQWQPQGGPRTFPTLFQNDPSYPNHCKMVRERSSQLQMFMLALGLSHDEAMFECAAERHKTRFGTTFWFLQHSLWGQRCRWPKVYIKRPNASKSS